MLQRLAASTNSVQPTIFQPFEKSTFKDAAHTLDDSLGRFEILMRRISGFCSRCPALPVRRRSPIVPRFEGKRRGTRLLWIDQNHGIQTGDSSRPLYFA
jgi:hypothetical protein